MDPLNRLLLDLHARADTAPYFADVPLFVMRPRLEPDGTAKDNASFASINEKVADAINCLTLKAGKGGACVKFLMPLGDNERPNVEGPQLKFGISMLVHEHPVLNWGKNGTRKTSEEIGLRLIQLFHLFMPNGGNCVAADNATLTATDKFAPLVTHEVRFTQQGNLPRIRRVTRPILSVTSGTAPATVQVTCANPGARLFYTVDGSYPSSVNLSAYAYAAPIEITEPCTLRVAAELAGYDQSDVSQGYFS